MSIINNCNTGQLERMNRDSKRMRRWAGIVIGVLLIGGCNQSNIKSSKSHFLRPTNPPVYLNSEPDNQNSDMVSDAAADENSQEKEEVYTITVTEMSVQDLLFALARDANKNIDVYPGITGRVTLSAIDQTLPQILDRIANQVAIRYEINDGTIIVSPDRAYLKIYEIDYINIQRSSKSSNKVSTRLSTANLNSSSDLNLSDDSNLSTSNLDTSTTNQFWQTLTGNIHSILNPNASSSSDVTIPSSSLSAESGDLLTAIPGGLSESTLNNNSGATTNKSGVVAVNPEAGQISIFASSSQHERIQALLDSIMGSVHRQVMIESTVVEVELNDQFQEGVDWDIMFNSAADIGIKGIFSKGEFFTIGRDPSPISSVTSTKAIRAAIKVLETFGNTKVLSSPKIMALNNQPALLKVVQNKVFFTLESSATNTTTTGVDQQTAQIPVFNTKIHTVPVGLIMNVTPQISKDGIVTLNVRPTITRIVSEVNDPNPALQANQLTTGISTSIENMIPEIEVKEMETIMRIHSGQVAVMGGLMQDEIVNESNGLPGLGRIPGLGTLFSHKDRSVKKSELVIFLRPVIIGHDNPRNNRMVAKNTTKHLSTDTAGSSAQPQAVPFEDQAPVPAAQEPIAAPANLPVASPTMAPTALGGGSYLDFTSPQGFNQPVPARLPAEQPEPPAPMNYGDLAPIPQQQTRAPANLDNQPYYQQASMTQQSAALPEAYAPQQQMGYFVDLGSYLERTHANDVQRKINAIGLPIQQESALVQGQTYQRVRSGPFPSQEAASQAMAKITNYTGIQARVARF
ncbi:MAG: pilus (MSHA type) biogenesis protein MshL [Magnetococcales bacterium]|nr:pilus (MSHA type) biogenesis protein MshL [Magnetococcales bacterium]